METSPFPLGFWESPGIDIRLNPRLSYHTAGLADFIREETGIESAVVLATSGTTGNAKFVVLKKSAMLASARSVNSHLQVTDQDTWLAALTLFHVGGLQIFARAALAGSRVNTVADPMSWDRTGAEFCNQCRANEITLTALTPTHLADLIANDQPAPESLRCVLIGGGAMTDSLVMKSLDLGWPIHATYGMTESCSQIATALKPEQSIAGWLPVLPGWEVKKNGPADRNDAEFSIRGDALFSAYISRDEQKATWKAQSPFNESGFFPTSDVVLLRNHGTELKFISRRDDLVKVRGELVSISRLDRQLFPEGVALALPDERLGHRLIAVVESENAHQHALDVSAAQPPFARFEEILVIEELPRTAIGKIDKSRLFRSITDL